MKDHVFVHIFLAYFCSRVAASFVTVVCDTDFAIKYMFIFIIYVYLRTEDCCSTQKYLCLTSSTNVWNWSPVKSYFLFFQIYLGLYDIRMFNFYT